MNRSACVGSYRCVHVCVSMQVCSVCDMQVYVYGVLVCVHACVTVYVYACVFVHVCVVYAFMYVCGVHVYVFVHVCGVCSSMYVCVHTYVCSMGCACVCTMCKSTVYECGVHV